MKFSEIPTIYINLEERTDRKVHVNTELHKLKINTPYRMPAVKLLSGNGALGCSMSHLKCVEHAKKQNYPLVFICEDDITFLNPAVLESQLEMFFKYASREKLDWNVIIVGGNNMVPYVSVNSFCIKVSNCQTTTGYIVNSAYYDVLINNYKEGIKKQMEDPTNPNYKIDKYWFRLQQADKWYMLIPPTVVQREDYSDIEKRRTNFQEYMLNYNKAYK